MAAGLDPRAPCPALGGKRLELGQQPAAKPEPACGWVHPHALDLTRLAPVELHRSAPDRSPAQVRDEHRSLARTHLARLGAGERGRIEARARALLKLREVGGETAFRVGGEWVDDADVDQRGRQEPLDGGHRVNQLVALLRVERSEHRLGEVVAALVEALALAPARACEASNARAPIRGTRRQRYETRVLERADRATEVTGVEVEPSAQRAQLAAVRADLPQQP